jgi:DNA mismatch repair protein MSH6
VLGPIANNSRGRAIKRQRISVEEDSDDEFGLDPATQQAMLEDGMLANRVFVTRQLINA